MTFSAQTAANKAIRQWQDQVCVVEGGGLGMQATKPVGIELWWNRSIIAVFGTMGILAFIGSVRNLSLSWLSVNPTK